MNSKNNLSHDFSEKVVLITGGTSGIGLSAVDAFSRSGATVIFTGRRQKEGEETEARMKQEHKKVCFINSDVSAETGQKPVFDFIISKYGKLDVVINNAGIELECSIQDIEYDAYREIFDINTWGVIASMKHATRIMEAQGSGVIINISSIAGHVGVPGFGIYSATKHAVEGLTKTAALEFARKGIRINSIAPAFINTPMVRRYTNDDVDKNARLASMHPAGRIGHPDEVVQSIMFLCSSGATFITGESLRVDGGWTAQ
ncbi:SDR family NAD(P)-dependent oxidoreductase [Enterobacter mori]